MENVTEVLRKLYARLDSMLGLPEFSVSVIDLIEIVILTVLVYNILLWIKSTRAWNLFKGILVILVFVLVAVIFQMNTILFIAKNTVNVGLIALVVIFQPELRKALENIGGKSFITRFISVNRPEEEQITDRTIDELVRASVAMAKDKTGALIVLENKIRLDEFIRTGIDVDAQLTSQLLINIFEKNTPLHDGAVIVRKNRVVCATCYLPLSDNVRLSKDLGTRHRAAVGVSEVSDSLTIVVSEETGMVSVASGGRIYRNLTAETLKQHLSGLKGRDDEENRLGMRLRRRFKNG